MFWNKFIDLCNANNTTPNAVGKSIGVSSAAVTYWKNGAQPRDTAIVKICDHFNLPRNYFSDHAENQPVIINYSGNERIDNIIKDLTSSDVDDNDLSVIEAVLNKYK